VDNQSSFLGKFQTSLTKEGRTFQRKILLEHIPEHIEADFTARKCNCLNLEERIPRIPSPFRKNPA